ncbi:P-loop NTPase fold protein [Pseudoclavibacter sp. RFBA6]|uniref:P-loop NTPase fold protein n=1 Tax=Pseudoclavibacter sp. RFBA6 TaxID=2080573 RepID=UPI001CA5E7E5
MAIGLSGAWGSDKTSVLELVKSEIRERSLHGERVVLVIRRSAGSTTRQLAPRRAS